MNIQDRCHLWWTDWISLQSKGLSRVFSNTTVQKHQFFCAQLYVMWCDSEEANNRGFRIVVSIFHVPIFVHNVNNIVRYYIESRILDFPLSKFHCSSSELSTCSSEDFDSVITHIQDLCCASPEMIKYYICEVISNSCIDLQRSVINLKAKHCVRTSCLLSFNSFFFLILLFGLF